MADGSENGSSKAFDGTPCPDCTRLLDPFTGLCFSCAAGARLPGSARAMEVSSAIEKPPLGESSSDEDDAQEDAEEGLANTPLLDIGNIAADSGSNTGPSARKSEDNGAEEEVLKSGSDNSGAAIGASNFTGVEEDRETKFFRELQEIKDTGRRLIVLLGFKGAGKTWLLHRIKEHYFETAPCIPPFVRVKASEGEQELPASDYFSFHTFATDPAFAILDTPGEYTKYLVKKDEAGMNALRPLMAALQYANSLIVAMPADIAIFGPGLEEIDSETMLAEQEIAKDSDEYKEFNGWRDDAILQSNELDEFAYGVHNMVAAMGLAHEEGVNYEDETAYAEKINVDTVNRFVIDNFSKCPFEKPTFFALTKADRVISVLLDPEDEAGLFKSKSEDDDRLREHMKRLRQTTQGKAMELAMQKSGLKDAIAYPRNVPSKLLLRVRKRLQQRFLNLFPMARFDYVSSFFGHDFTNKIRKKHYELHPAIGVAEMVDWMREARDMDGNKAPRLADYEMARDHHLRWNGMDPDKIAKGM